MAIRRGKSQARRNTGNGTPGWVWLVAGAAIAAVVFIAAPGLFKKDASGFLRLGPYPNPDAQPAPVADADADVQSAPAKPDKTKPADPHTQYDFYTLLPGKEVRMSDAELAASARAEDAARARGVLEGKPASSAATTANPAVAATPARPAQSNSMPNALPENTASMPQPVQETAPPQPTATTPANTAPMAASPVATPIAASDNARYILQAGSFAASGDAESAKAKLAMIGLSARVESADIAGKTVYRVRMGPYGTASELAEIKQKLSGSGLPAIAIKVR